MLDSLSLCDSVSVGGFRGDRGAAGEVTRLSASSGLSAPDALRGHTGSKRRGEGRDGSMHPH